MIREQKYLTTLAYQMASFNNSKKRLKPLKEYLKKIDGVRSKKLTAMDLKNDLERNEYG